MQQNIENKNINRLATLLVCIGKFYCGFLILHLGFRLLVA